MCVCVSQCSAYAVFQAMSPEYNKKFSDLEEFTSLDNSYRNVRLKLEVCLEIKTSDNTLRCCISVTMLLKESRWNALPYEGLTLTALTVIEETAPVFIEMDGVTLINFEPCWGITEQIQTIMAYKQQQGASPYFR